MATITARTLDGQTTTLDDATVESLAAALGGELVTPDSPDYDDVRAIWNGMIDRRPALVVRCAGTADVMRSVRFARERNLLASVRGGGHHIAGNSVVDGGMLIDLSPMRWVQVDPAARTAMVAPGATLADVDRETQAFGLALPTGINSTTGIAGLTLGGGFGWLTRKHGMTIDNLIAADVVTADGELLRAGADDDAELFWAIRGGGGNFGIVTSFEFRLHPVGPEVFAGLIVYSLEEGEEVLRGWRDALPGLPEETSVWTILRKAPPLPFLPEEVHGSEVVVLAFVDIGDADGAPARIEPFTRLGTRLGQHMGRQPFAAFQQAFDPLLAPGARNYWKSHDFAAVADPLIDVLVAAAWELPSDECEVFVGQLGGAAARVPVEATAYPGRQAAFVMNVHGRWQDPDLDEAGVAWSRQLFTDAQPWALGTAYVNFMTEEEQARVRQAYGANFERLLAAKKRYDPDNFFRVNHNLRRAAEIVAAE